MVLNCLQSFNLNRGNSITNTLSACKAFIFIFSSVYYIFFFNIYYCFFTYKFLFAL